MKPLTVKILGSGNAAKKHAQAFEALSEYYTITDSDDHDIVDICTPNYLHYDQACDAILREKHVIVEKPVCGSLEKIDHLINLEALTGRPILKVNAPKFRICPVFQYRFADHEDVPTSLASYWRRDLSYYDGWRGNPRTALGGCLISHGIHMIDLHIQKYGMPDSVYCNRFDFGDYDVERLICFTLYYSKKSPHGFSISLSPANPQEGFDLGDSMTGYINLFRAFHRSLDPSMPIKGDMPENREKRKRNLNMYPPTLQEARQSLEVITACYYSAYTGKPVTLPLGRDHPFYGGWSQAFAERTEQPSRHSRSSLRKSG